MRGGGDNGGGEEILFHFTLSVYGSMWPDSSTVQSQTLVSYARSFFLTPLARFVRVSI